MDCWLDLSMPWKNLKEYIADKSYGGHCVLENRANQSWFLIRIEDASVRNFFGGDKFKIHFRNKHLNGELFQFNFFAIRNHHHLVIVGIS